MNVKAILFGAAIGFFIAVAPSCGGNKCGPQNCGGCCDDKGACIARAQSNTDKVCGTQGNACVDCSATAQTCDTSSYTCKGGSTGGGTATGGGTTTGGGTATGGGTTTGGGSMGGGTASTCNINTQNCDNGYTCMYGDNKGSFTHCSLGACDLADPLACSSNKKCTYERVLPDAGIGRYCLPVEGTLTEGQRCDGIDGGGNDPCGPGLACIGNSNARVCMKFCTKDGMCGAGSCAVGPISTPNAGEFVTLCARGCKYFEQDCGNSFETCIPESGLNGLCSFSGGIDAGGACTSTNACKPGNLCIDTGAAQGLCAKLCNRDGGAPACESAGGDGGTCAELGAGYPFGACR